jgi:hypothetical protein
MLVQRVKYYIAWKLSSSSAIVCGLSYSYETPNPEKNCDLPVSPHKFDKIVNAVIRGIEWEVNPKNRIRVYQYKFNTKIFFIIRLFYN